MSTVLDRVEEMAEFLKEQADAADDLGRVPDETAKRLRATGIGRMLQPKDFDGLESSPLEFFEALLAIGSLHGSTGWVAGVVGVHPFELAVGTRRMQEEVWGHDPDTWVASPYAPLGRARPVEGGFVFSGRWPFSSGTDLCDWVVLGGMVTDQDGVVAGPNPLRHFILPRSDYEIIDDSWNVVGLRGTGSKDVLIRDAFVPDHRVIDPLDLETGAAADQAGRGDVPLYRMPFHTMFSGTIACATIALTEGALAAFVAHSRSRVSRAGHRVSQDPHQLASLGAAGADIQASRVQFLSDMGRLWDLAQRGEDMPLALRAQIRRNQVRAVRRSVDAVDRLVAHAGGHAMRLDNPIQRFWRDAHTGLAHASNVADPVYAAYGLNLYGRELPPGTRL
ncbi:hydroxylase [Knoellia sp. CPCC 206435]|uniref:hydroxylase n=1 Tax=Knoellia terrae TaxID=3404797 RepID=UPI003B43C5DC